MFCAKCGNPIRDGMAFCAGCGAPVAGAGPTVPPPFTPIPPSPTPYAPTTPPLAASLAPGGYASWADRVIGYIIDSLFVGAAIIVLMVVIGGFFGSMAALGGGEQMFGGAPQGMCCLVFVLFPVSTLLVGLYNRGYLVSQRGYSIGQGIMKLKVIDANGQLLTQGNAMIRLLAQAALGFIPFVGILDLLWPLWDDNRQTLHDKAVGAFVIHNPNAR